MNLKHVVFHSPGPNWQHGVDFREQPGVMDHVQHYAKLLQEGKLLLGGPFTDADAGGMMIATGDMSRDELEAFAADDPAIHSGLLTFDVKTWYIAMSEDG
ncbi:MAG: YciI family protein [Deinococcota bacterium]